MKKNVSVAKKATKLKREKKPAKLTKPTRRTFVYTDEKGAPLFRCVRMRVLIPRVHGEATIASSCRIRNTCPIGSAKYWEKTKLAGAASWGTNSPAIK